MLDNNNRQKSLKRRFLLILGITASIAFTSLGLMVIFWDSMLPNMPKTQKDSYRLRYNNLCCYLRFSRLLKKDPDEV